MKRIFALCTILAASLFILSACSPKGPVPLTQPGEYQFGTKMNISFTDASRDDRKISFYIWYPAILPADAEPSKYNFDAEPDFSNAPYPVILTSAKEGGYFGSHLATYGFIVIGVDGQDAQDHYGTWLIDYPLDQIAALNYVTDNPPEGLEGMLDTDHVGAIGYSFGGYNALALGGARIDPEFYQSQCANATPGDPLPELWWIDYICNIDSGWDNFVSYAGQEITESEDGLWQPLTDPRIQAVMPIVPEGEWLFGESGLAAVDRPTLILAATEDDINPYSLEAVSIYDQLITPDKIMISFVGQDHMMIFNDEQLSLIKQFAVAFFGYHLQEKSEYIEYLEENFIVGQENLVLGVYEE